MFPLFCHYWFEQCLNEFLQMKHKHKIMVYKLTKKEKIDENLSAFKAHLQAFTKKPITSAIFDRWCCRRMMVEESNYLKHLSINSKTFESICPPMTFTVLTTVLSLIFDLSDIDRWYFLQTHWVYTCTKLIWTDHSIFETDDVENKGVASTKHENRSQKLDFFFSKICILLKFVYDLT